MPIFFELKLIFKEVSEKKIRCTLGIILKNEQVWVGTVIPENKKIASLL